MAVLSGRLLLIPFGMAAVGFLYAYCYTYMSTSVNWRGTIYSYARRNPSTRGSSKSDTQLHSLTRELSNFTFAPDFSLPHPLAYLPLDCFKDSPWIEHLHGYLTSIRPARTVTVTVATESFLPNLLNWLISATLVADPPLKHIITVALDVSVHQLLTKRNIMSILVPDNSLLNDMFIGRVQRIWLLRLAVVRILNHWGYHVQQLDADAIVLRNPQPLFDMYPQFDIVASKGMLPKSLLRSGWKFTMCMGVISFRSSWPMESLWKTMHNSDLGNTTDDQARVNTALKKTGMVWRDVPTYVRTETTGVNKLGVKVGIIPEPYICRRRCNTTDGSYYILHQSMVGHNPDSKAEYSKGDNVWFLLPDWRKINDKSHSSIVGNNWLTAIADMGIVASHRHRHYA